MLPLPMTLSQSYLLTSLDDLLKQAHDTGDDDDDDTNSLRHRQIVESESVVVVIVGDVRLLHLRHFKSE